MPGPNHPVRWTLTTHRGETVEMVRLLHVDLVRAYLQEPPVRSGHAREDTGYQGLADYGALRDYVDRRFALYDLQVVGFTEGRPTGSTQECWISVPSTTSPNYRTHKTQWDTLLRKWPRFIEPEFLTPPSG